jgi:hypothetical protein
VVTCSGEGKKSGTVPGDFLAVPGRARHLLRDDATGVLGLHPEGPLLPIVDQLYDDVPTLKSIAVCLNSLRVVSPGDRR